jgi:glutaconate CoA-transferase subunit B
MTNDWTRGEMLAVAASRYITNEDVVLVGLGLPQMAAGLAQHTHAPSVRVLLEIGVFNPELGEPAMGIADPRMWQGASAFAGMLDVLGGMLHGGRVSLGLLGALEVDPTGAINTTLVGADGQERRFNGSGGGNDVASSAGRVVVVMRHDARKFTPAVRFLTSPGRRMTGGRQRAEAGLRGAGTTTIVTDRAILHLSNLGAELVSIHPGESADAVRADTPMPMDSSASVPITEPPADKQLDLLRSRLDPNKWYTA